jgi:hypothetical protein
MRGIRPVPTAVLRARDLGTSGTIGLIAYLGCLPCPFGAIRGIMRSILSESQHGLVPLR